MKPEKSRIVDQGAADEAAVRAVIDALTDAVRAKDVEAMLSQCDSEIVTFDMIPPIMTCCVNQSKEVWIHGT